MKKTILLLAGVLVYCSTALGQSSKMIEMINKQGFWRPAVMWLNSDDEMNYYLKLLDDMTIKRMETTKKQMKYDHETASQLMETYKAIVGKKKGKKADEKLALHFNNVEQAKQIFTIAEEVERRYATITDAIDYNISHHVSKTMPEGALKHFSFSNGNGFAGFKETIELKKEEDKRLLLVEVQNRMRMQDPPKEALPVEVEDSVFQRVRDMVETGKLYDISRDYMDDYQVMDASNWSLYIVFEKGTISSHGYAIGPDNSDALREITYYLSKLYDELKPADEEKENTENTEDAK